MQGNMAGVVAEAGPISEELMAFLGSIRTDGTSGNSMPSHCRMYPSSIQSNELCVFVYFFPISIEVWEINQV